MSTQIKSSNNDFSASLADFDSLNFEKNTFSEMPEQVATFGIDLEELNMKSDMLLPNRRAEIKVLQGVCEINGIACTAGDLLHAVELASVSLRTRFEQSAKVIIQYIKI
jgi:hypothetical protein